MMLSKEDGELFYKLWLPLLQFTNEVLDVNRAFEDISETRGLDMALVKEIACVLWDNLELIDDFIEACKNMLKEDEKQILLGWKKRIQGTFFIERYLKNGAIMIANEGGQIYQVLGIQSSIEEMFRYASLPLAVDAVLIPFRDKIITDGLIVPCNIYLGSEMTRDLKDVYMEAKKSRKIIKSL